MRAPTCCSYKTNCSVHESVRKLAGFKANSGPTSPCLFVYLCFIGGGNVCE